MFPFVCERVFYCHGYGLSPVHVVSSFSWCCYFIVMEFECANSLVDSFPSILPLYLLRHFWHFRVFMLLRVYLLRVGFGCITFPTVLLVLKNMLMFVFSKSFV
jgi:hypothetical protein